MIVLHQIFRRTMNFEKFSVLLLVVFAFPYTVILYLYSERLSVDPKSPISITIVNRPCPEKKAVTPSNERTLILYVWADTNVQALGNLQFFVKYAVHSSQPADYYFILQRLDKKPVNESRLPALPANARYLQHDNECYDIGTFGWFFQQNIVNTTLYKYILFMNSSVRGPFLVTPLLYASVWWFTLFTTRLTDKIKLVGSSISCANHPHVQSYVMVTDQVGLSILRGTNSTVFRCHAGYDDAVMNGEIAASQILLNSSYQIASFQTKYQGWDFSRPENQQCNSRMSPIYNDNDFDGISHDPYELIFVKFKGEPPFDTDLERRAQVYQKWLEESPEMKEIFE